MKQEAQKRHREKRTDTRRPSAQQERSEEHTSELQSRLHLVCRLLLEKKKKVSTIVEIGCAVPIAYAIPTSQRDAAPEATTCLAALRAAYAAVRSTLVGSLPEKQPPPT